MQNFGKLEITTPSDREIAFTRSLDAPRQLVFDAWTKPELLKRWLYGPNGWSLVTCEVDLRAGGRYRYVWHHTNGNEMGMGGVYREVVPPERIVNTQLFDQDWTEGEAVGTLVLTEKDSKTTSVNTVLYATKQARDGALSTPMADGMEMGYVRMDEMFASLAKEAR
ncbi:MAG TPA: SRPBCC family protein [Candidatus Angelobacter sp.]|jgi:uncharacterized protein YndB with AHSA1/START domain